MSRNFRKNPFGDRRNRQFDDSFNDYNEYDEYDQSPSPGRGHDPPPEDDYSKENRRPSCSACSTRPARPSRDPHYHHAFPGSAHDGHDNPREGTYSGLENRLRRGMGRPELPDDPAPRTGRNNHHQHRAEHNDNGPDPGTAHGRARIALARQMARGYEPSERRGGEFLSLRDALLVERYGNALSYDECMQLALRTMDDAERESYGDNPPVFLGFGTGEGKWWAIWAD